MSLTRYQERLDEFGNALSRLHEALSYPETDLLRDAVIQRFEFTYELSWKTMKLWLAVNDIHASFPKDVFIEGVKFDLIADGNLWSDLHDKRNLTSHTYNEVTAREVFETIKNYAIPAFDALYETLKQKVPT